jgi:hypothetical protein
LNLHRKFADRRRCAAAPVTAPDDPFSAIINKKLVLIHRYIHKFIPQ